MTILEALRTTIDTDEARILLAYILSVEKIYLVTHATDQLAPAHVRRFQALVARRQKQEPIAYLIGSKDFFGRTFMVNRTTLIPRPETETLIEYIIADLNPLRLPLRKGESDAGTVIWDVGTGSGCIATTISKELPSANVFASDVSKRALQVAKKNTKTHNARVTFFHANLLNVEIYKKLLSTSKKIPTLHIVANLPYLPESDKKILGKNVVDFEPSRALFSGKDGNDLIKKFLRQCARLIPEWDFQHITIWLEVDPPQIQILLKLSQTIFPTGKITILPDLCGRDRFISIKLN